MLFTTIETTTEDTDPEILIYIPQDDVRFKVYLEIHLAASILGIMGNLLIILIMLRFKKLRREKQNIAIVHWAITNTLFLIMSPTFLRLDELFNLRNVYNQVFCILEEFEYSIMNIMLWFIVYITVHWYTKPYFPEINLKIKRNFNLFIVIIYLVGICVFGIITQSCNHLTYAETVGALFRIVMHFSFLIFMVIINMCHGIRKGMRDYVDDSENVYCMLTNAFLLSNGPLLIAMMIVPLYRSTDVLVFIFAIIAICNPIYNIIILYKYDEDFRKYFKQVISCKCTNYSEQIDLEDVVVYHNDIERY